MDAVADVTAVCLLMELLAPEQVIVSRFMSALNRNCARMADCDSGACHSFDS